MATILHATVQDIAHLLFVQLDLGVITVDVSNCIHNLVFPNPPETPHGDLGRLFCLWIEVRDGFVDS